MNARKTGRDHDRINVLCFKPKSFAYEALLLIALLEFKNRTFVQNKNSFVGRILCGGVHKQREVQAVASMCITYDLRLLCVPSAMRS